MKNMQWCIYTYRHRKAFEYCVRKYIHEPALREEMLRRAAVHDMDKMIMYLLMDQKDSSAWQKASIIVLFFLRKKIKAWYLMMKYKRNH